ncbi:MAG: Tm-1-like ATP-binding domain-containing protein [Devosia sp.]
MTARAAIIASLDSKPGEALFLRDRLAEHGIEALIIDFGIKADPPLAPDITAAEVARRGGATLETLRRDGKRDAAIDAMARGAAAIVSDLYARGELAGVISVGGSGGTTVGTAAMRALPLGVPKVMVSTLASGDTRAFVDISDIVMLNSVADFAGVNPISEPILGNAAAGLAGMIAARARRKAAPKASRLIAATMFGVTTPAVEKCRVLVERAGYSLVPFHATGIGGRTMEALIAEGHFAGVLDLTTTEWADEVVGGTLSAGPHRLEAAARTGTPQVLAPGALDMVNFFGAAGVPERFAGRRIHRHSENSYLMRTTPGENAEIGRRIAEKLNAATGPVTFLFPLRGVSALDAEGQPFFDPDADAALRASLGENLRPPVRFEPLDCHINDDAFAEAAVRTLLASLPTAAMEQSHAQDHR